MKRREDDLRPTDAISVRGVGCRFGAVTAISELDLAVPVGQVHALLGRNGAGKTTLLRILAGLVRPTSGTAHVLGRVPDLADRWFRGVYGYVPSGARSFYLRLSGRENLVFFARLEGFPRSAADRQARRWLDELGLTEASERPVGLYSRGMQRRLALARALLASPPVLLLDEVTHDLDPGAAEHVRRLVRRRATEGATVIWVTQRVEEIRGLADTVTVLHEGRASFGGTVADLVSTVSFEQFVLRLRNGATAVDLASLQRLLGDRATLQQTEEHEHYLLGLRHGIVLGDALAELTAGGISVLSCSARRPVVETALHRATGATT